MWQAISLARKLTDIAMWVNNNPRVAIEAAIVAALLFLGWSYNLKKAELARVQFEKGELADGLKQQILIRDGQIEILKKQKGKVTTEIIYVPVEGQVIIQYPDTPNADPVIKVKDKGFTFRPGFGIEWANNGLSPRLDAKLAYYKRYSLLVGGGKGGLDVSASRHLDDILFGSPRNIEAFAGYKFLRINGAASIALGLRSNF